MAFWCFYCSSFHPVLLEFVWTPFVSWCHWANCFIWELYAALLKSWQLTLMMSW